MDHDKVYDTFLYKRRQASVFIRNMSWFFFQVSEQTSLLIPTSKRKYMKNPWWADGGGGGKEKTLRV